MVFKLLIVILTLLVLDTSAQQNRILDDWDFYKYGFHKDLDKRHQHETNTDDDVEPGLLISHCEGSNCNTIRKPLDGNEVRNDKRDYLNRFWDRIALMNILHSLPRDHRPVIVIPDEFDNKIEK